MHELSITQGIIKLVAREAEERGFTKCLSINVAVGEYSGIVPECINEFFPLAAQGTAAEGARLVFSPAEDRFRCYVESLEVE